CHGPSPEISTREPLVKSVPKFNPKTNNETMPTIKNTLEKMKNLLRCLTKSNQMLTFRSSPLAKFAISDRFTPNHPGLLSRNLLFTQSSSNILEPYTAVKKLTKMLTINMTAKPLTELVPYTNMTPAA